MKITRTSMLSGETRTKEIDVTKEQVKKWADGMVIQNAMPHLSTDDREFVINGCTPEDWAEHEKKYPEPE